MNTRIWSSMSLSLCGGSLALSMLSGCSGAQEGAQMELTQAGMPVGGAVVASMSCEGVRLNELNPGGAPDWVELYNQGTETAHLAGCYLSDDLSEPLKANLGDQTVPPGGFLVLDVSDETLGFKLGKSEAVVLSTSQGELVDTLEYNEEQFMGAETIGRFPDGVGEWVALESASPGEPNQPAPAPEQGGSEPEVAGAEPEVAGVEPEVAGVEPEAGGTVPGTTPEGRLVINEVAAKGDPSDWVELLYLAPEGSEALDLSAYSLSDQGDYALAAPLVGYSIQPQERLIVEVSDETLGFKLGGDEAVYLWDPSGAMIDSVDWEEGESPEGGSLSRVPDGTGPFTTTAVHSRGAENG